MLSVAETAVRFNNFTCDGPKNLGVTIVSAVFLPWVLNYISSLYRRFRTCNSMLAGYYDHRTQHHLYRCIPEQRLLDRAKDCFYLDDVVRLASDIYTWCDNIRNCADGTDEMNCHNSSIVDCLGVTGEVLLSCTHGFHKQKDQFYRSRQSKSACLFDGWLCNNVKNCVLTDDEQFCR